MLPNESCVVRTLYVCKLEVINLNSAIRINSTKGIFFASITIVWNTNGRLAIHMHRTYFTMAHKLDFLFKHFLKNQRSYHFILNLYFDFLCIAVSLQLGNVLYKSPLLLMQSVEKKLTQAAVQGEQCMAKYVGNI